LRPDSAVRHDQCTRFPQSYSLLGARPVRLPRYGPGAFSFAQLDHPRTLTQFDQLVGIHARRCAVGRLRDWQVGAMGQCLVVAVAAHDAERQIGAHRNQTIVGNNGSNTIAGSPGYDLNFDGVVDYDGLDVMTGNGGGDVFVWTSTNQTTLAGEEADVVTDFNRAEGDLLAFNSIDANAMGGTANDEFTFVGIVDVTQGGSFAGVGQIGYFTTATDTFILLNTEVDAGVDYQDATIRVAGVHTVDTTVGSCCDRVRRYRHISRDSRPQPQRPASATTL
jgi:hypothetical protein